MKDAEVNAVDGTGETPLHEAAERGFLDIVEVMPMKLVTQTEVL